MRTYIRCMALCALSLVMGRMEVSGADEGRDAVVISDMTLAGEIDGENIVFDLNLTARPAERGAQMMLAAGDVAYLDGRFPRGATLQRQGDRYSLKFASTRRHDILFRFAARPEKEGEWRRTAFEAPAASVRKVSLLCDRDDLEVQFPGALDVQREKTAGGKTRLTAYLGQTNRFEVAWKPEIKRLEGDLVVACEAHTIAAASVGALRLDQVFTYRVIQGELTHLALLLPAVSITQVQGEDIQDWRVEPAGPQGPARLLVTLSRRQEQRYRLHVQSEMVLPKFPCRFDLPVLTPEQVMRTSGFLLIGADSAIKLQVARISGLTQIDPAAVPHVDGGAGLEARRAPVRSASAYQFANMPYAAEITADDVVPSVSADCRHVVTVGENELSLTSSVELDIRDAPLREVVLKGAVLPGWTVTGVTGQQVAEADVDVRDDGALRTITVPFKAAISGTALLTVQMAKSALVGEERLTLPGLTVVGAKAERGYLVAAAERGLRLRVAQSGGLREVPTGLAPMRVEQAQLAFRFKEAGWSAVFELDRTAPSLHSEVLHVVSLGEGVLYESAAISYHIGGAPVQELRLRIPEAISNVELTGADIEGWTRSNDVCTVRLQTRTMGDYTLLVTHDRQYALPSSELDVGMIETIGTASEVGFIALASSLSLKLADAAPLSPSILTVDREELPQEYATLVTAPILRAYHYTRTPHQVRVSVAMLETEQLLGQVADYVKLSTVLSAEGEAVTTALYFIKNATRQFFVMEMPPGAQVWAIKSVAEDGTRENLLSQQKGQTVLVPVARPRDPNTALRVEVTYAQACGKAGFWRSGVAGIRLRGPDLPQAHATFSAWRIESPETYVLAGLEGNMTLAGGQGERWIGATLRRMLGVTGTLLDGVGGRTLRPLLTINPQAGRSVDLIRSVNLKGTAAPEVRLRVTPVWMGPAGSARTLVVAGLAGVLLLVIGHLRGRLWLRAAGWTALLVAVGQMEMGRMALALAGIGVAIVAVLWLLRGLWRAGLGCVVSALLCWPWKVLKAVGRRVVGRRRGLGALPADGDLPFDPSTPARADDPTAGRVSIGLLLLTMAAALAALRGVAGETAPPPAPVMASVNLTIEGPGSGRDIEPSARVVASYEFEIEGPGTFLLAPGTCVLKRMDLGSEALQVRSLESGYVLECSRKGRYKSVVEFQVPVQVIEGRSTLPLPMPPALRSRALLHLPELDLDVQSEAAVLLKTKTTADATEAEAVFGIGRAPSFTWRPRVRRTTLEASVFYATVNTLATLQPGVVDVASDIACQIAQGEIRQMTLAIPEGMNVTAVHGDNLATWNFDPALRRMAVILDKGIGGSYRLVVVGQYTCDGLPYSLRVGVPTIVDAARQRGALAFAGAETVQVRVDDTKGLNPMNIEDFPAAPFAGPGVPPPAGLRRAYRYDQPDAVVAMVSAERVLPEIRVTESGSVSISDERTVLATKLTLGIAKAGIFSATLDLPDGFEVESLTGRDVSHWEETRDATRSVTVNFTRQVADETVMDLVVSRTVKGVEPTIPVPRVAVRDARRHGGRLVISGERGLRLMIQDHSGVDLKKATDEGIGQAGVLVFDLLRPAWSVTLRTEVLTPVVKPEVLQVVEVTEGMLLCRAYLRFTIDNAGVKSFRIKAPVPGVTLSVAGRNISRVQETDKAAGLWQIDLHGKVEKVYALTVTYQLPYDRSAQRVTLTPLGTVGTDAPRGYLVITSSGRVQIEPEEAVTGLKIEDPRNVPPAFGAGDLSSALRCYRIVQADWTLPLSVVRHETAQVLAATVKQVRMTSVLSEDGKVLTRVLMQVDVGSLRLLKFALPLPGDVLWTALVNGGEVATSRDNQAYCIPLDEPVAGQSTLIDLVYSGASSAGRFDSRQKYEAPRFEGLPLRDIEWSFFVVPNMRYHGFGGTMEPRVLPYDALHSFDAEKYWAWNIDRRNATIEKAREELNTGEALMKSGNEKGAKKAFQDAMNYSQSEFDLNEDARVQLRNLQKQQVKVGLYNRRGAMRSARNIMTDDTEAQQGSAVQQSGDQVLLPQAAQTVDRLLSDKDKFAFEAVADRLIEQQAAAAGLVRTIDVTIPEQGRRLVFHRPMLIDPGDELSVIFKGSRGLVRTRLAQLWPLGLLFAGLWLVMGWRARRA